jgi:hypothetical protein
VSVLVLPVVKPVVVVVVDVVVVVVVVMMLTCGCGACVYCAGWCVGVTEVVVWGDGGFC